MKSNRFAGCLVLHLGVLSTGVIVMHGQAASSIIPYVAEGTWSWTEYGNTRTNSYSQMPFRAEITEGSYLFSGDETTPSDIFVQVGSDGVDCYSLEYPLAWKGKTVAANQEAKLPHALGAVCAGAFPPPEYTFMQTLWLAFVCPRDKALARQPVLPFGILKSSDPDLDLEAYWAEYEARSMSGLVSEMRIYGPGIGKDRNGESYSLREPFQRGYLAMRYRVHRFQETNGMDIPVEFSLERYWVRSAKMLFVNPRTRDDAALQYSWDFTVTNIYFAPTLAWHPPEFHPSLVALVNELRLGNNQDQARGYTRRQMNSWPSRASTEFKVRQEQTRAIARKKLARRILWIALSAAFLSAIFIIGRRWMRRSAQGT